MNHPAAAATTIADLTNARPGLVVHAALRREMLLAGPLVRRVGDGDTARAAVVGRHVDLVLRMLHHHHESEDQGVFPALRERAGTSVIPLLDLMDRQHVRIEQLTAAAEARLASWIATACVTAGDQLAAGLDELHAILAEHLDAEERDLFGLAEQHITATEWDELGAQASAAFAGKERALVFGILQYGADASVIAQMLETAPGPVRFLVPRVARRAHRRHAVELHGTPTP